MFHSPSFSGGHGYSIGVKEACIFGGGGDLFELLSQLVLQVRCGLAPTFLLVCLARGLLHDRVRIRVLPKLTC